MVHDPAAITKSLKEANKDLADLLRSLQKDESTNKAICQELAIMNRAIVDIGAILECNKHNKKPAS